MEKEKAGGETIFVSHPGSSGCGDVIRNRERAYIRGILIWEGEFLIDRRRGSANGFWKNTEAGHTNPTRK